MIDHAVPRVTALCLCLSFLLLAGCGVEGEKIVQIKPVDMNSLSPEQRAQVEKNLQMLGGAPGAGGQTPQETILQNIKNEQERQANEKAAGGAKE